MSDKNSSQIFSETPLPEMIVERRHRLRFSRHELSKLLGVNLSQYSAWEDGTKPMPTALWLGLKAVADGIVCGDRSTWTEWKIHNDRLCDPYSDETFCPGDLRSMFFNRQITRELEAQNQKLRARVAAQKEREAAHWDTRDFMLGRFCSLIPVLIAMGSDLKDSSDPVLSEIGEPFADLAEKLMGLMVRLPTDLSLDDVAESMPPGSSRIQ